VTKAGSEVGKKRKSAQIAAQAEQMERDLGAIRQALRKPLENEVAKGQLTPPQHAVMRVVVHEHGISLRDLSRAVSLAHSTVSGIVDRLETRGLLERRTDPHDGRVARVYPTAPVVAFVREQIPALARGPLQKALERAKEGEREIIQRALKRLRELLEEGQAC
jgi:DNA-binding MarR family transcriptional regulator